MDIIWYLDICIVFFFFFFLLKAKLHTLEATSVFRQQEQQIYFVMCHFVSNFSLYEYTGCFKKSFTNVDAYINLFRGYLECFELS
jgi:hypothetical protein